MNEQSYFINVIMSCHSKKRHYVLKQYEVRKLHFLNQSGILEMKSGILEMKPEYYVIYTCSTKKGFICKLL